MFIVKIGCSYLIIMAAFTVCYHYQYGDCGCLVVVGVHGEKRLVIMFFLNSLLNDQTCSSVIVFKEHM